MYVYVWKQIPSILYISQIHNKKIKKKKINEDECVPDRDRDRKNETKQEKKIA